jgi:6-phosphogluconolactonase
MSKWLTIPGTESAAAVAHALLPHVQGALQAQGSALLALAGGRTPGDAYATMAAADLDWPRVTIVPTDERWVDVGHADSNESMLRRCFHHTGRAAPAVLSLRGTARALAAAAADADTAVAALKRPFDLMVLGVGIDGHIASLFPGAAELGAAMAENTAANVMVVHPNSNAPPPAVPRLTLSLRRLLWTRQLVLLFGGIAKRRVVEAAIRTPELSRLPVSALFRAGAPPVQVIYLEES